MNETHLAKIAAEYHLNLPAVQATARLLAEGATVPFIARYRKEATGGLDEVAIAAVRDRTAQLAELDGRREAIIKSLQERALLTDSLHQAVAAAETLAALEDLYLPYRPKKRTRAMIAREQGLEGLADQLLAQDDTLDPAAAAAAFVDAAKGVADAPAALQGARDIIAERVSEQADTRARIRELFLKQGVIVSEVLIGKEEDGAKFKDYFKWSEPIATAPSHRVLAIRRGAAEGFLYFRILPPEEQAIALLEEQFVTGRGAASEQVRAAVRDGYKRLLCTSMETEARLESKKRADLEAIHVFARNLRQLLLASPLGTKPVLAIDPGFRTGCKVVCLDRQGKLIHHTVIYPDQGAGRTAEAQETIKDLCRKHAIEAIAIGNGTGGRETEAFVRTLGLPEAIAVVMVNESGASIYSASEAAREEFPDQDITVRGSVSIGRRLMDPLAELVKLDPKSIGVGQYQHDVDQDALQRSLDDVVIGCVNAVGVEVNTASKQLLTYVSGLNARIADNIVAYRNAHGPFARRRDLLEVTGLGPKTFEQAAGFLRIRGAADPLDASAVHPERYATVDAMARDAACSVQELIRDGAKRAGINLQAYVSESVGMPTLRDIMAELAKPGRDPRQVFEPVKFTEGVAKIEDVQVGMKLTGVVTNVTAFGAFVDIGVHQDGLVHISQLADRFIKDASEVVQVQQKVEVTVLKVDLPRKRIALTMRRGAPVPTKGDGARTGPSSKPAAPPRVVPAAPTAPTQGWFTKAIEQSKKQK